MKADRALVSNLLVIAVAAAFSSLPAPTAHAHAFPSHEVLRAQKLDELGKLAFPASAKSPEAQSAFVEGMLLLHLFEYQHAQLAFCKALAKLGATAHARAGKAPTARATARTRGRLGIVRARLCPGDRWRCRRRGKIAGRATDIERHHAGAG